MTSVDATSPQPLPSLPPSPITEEDLGHAALVDNDGLEGTEERMSRKGKGKARQVDGGGGGPEDGDEVWGDGAARYPPVNEDDSETRKVQENLRRWEVAERQRRKAAREAVSSSSAAPSFIAGVTKRTSFLWPGRSKQQPPRADLGSHVALGSRESLDAVPMDDIPPGTSRSAASTPSRSSSFDAPHPEDPFTPIVTPFGEDQAQPLMDMTSEPPTPLPTRDNINQSKRPPLMASSSSFARVVPPPKPLGLPPPRTPPPPVDTPPNATAPPAVSTMSTITEEDERQTRWWHEWLCGCGEGADRGGENQAGRTNPFE